MHIAKRSFKGLRLIDYSPYCSIVISGYIDEEGIRLSRDACCKVRYSLFKRPKLRAFAGGGELLFKRLLLYLPVNSLGRQRLPLFLEGFSLLSC